MSTRRRIGVSAATTEAARRQLMQPVPCWERTWQNMPGSSVKIYKWVKTDKFPQFGEDEGTVDEPLAPLDIPEEAEGDEEMDAENSNEPGIAPKESAVPSELPSKQPSPSPSSAPKQEHEDEPEQPVPTALTMVVDEEGGTSGLTLAADADVDTESKLGPEHEVLVEDGVQLDMEALGPDGLPFESQHELSQVDAGDALLGGLILDGSDIDPFATTEGDKGISG